MPDRNSYEIGRDLETHAASTLGGRLVPQSGGGHFIKLDLSDRGNFVFSAKASLSIKDTALRAIWKLWQETIRGTRGYSGHGDGAKPGMIFEIGGEVLTLIRLDDYADIVTGKTVAYIEPTKAQERRSRSRNSLLG